LNFAYRPLSSRSPFGARRRSFSSIAINQPTRGPAGFCAILDQVGERAISETRKIAAILVADIVGYSRLAGADEDRTLSRLRGCAAI
jgi:hypothetical protein